MCLKMKKISLYVLVSFLSIVNGCMVTKLSIAIYYEALCPDSVRFITEQLKDAYNDIKHSVQLEFIPYGNAYTYFYYGRYHFSCQHGPRECSANMLQACGLMQTADQDKQFQFVNCAMAAADPADGFEICECAIDNDISCRKISTCMKNGIGISLLKQHGDRTHNLRPAISFVPAITYNGYYNAPLSYDSLENFHDTVMNIVNKSNRCVDGF